MNNEEHECKGPAIKALGSLFKLTQVFLWDDGVHVSALRQSSKLVDVGDDGGFNLYRTFDDNSSLLPEDRELSRQMCALGLPVSFHTNKERNCVVRGKRKGAHKKNQHRFQNFMDEAPEFSKVSVEEVVFPTKFHDKTSSSLCCMSMLGKSESSYCDVAVDVNKSPCSSGRVNNSASSIMRVDVAFDDDQNGDSTRNNDLFNADMEFVSSTTDINPGVSPGGPLAEAGLIHCEEEDSARIVDHECSEVSSMVCELTEHEKICNNESTELPWVPESFPIYLDGTGCDGNAKFKYNDLGDWMVYWDSFYMRNYFYNIKTHVSTWYAPPGMEDLATGSSTETDDGAALKTTDEYDLQNNSNSLEEPLDKEMLMGKPHDNHSDEDGFAADYCVSDITYSGVYGQTSETKIEQLRLDEACSSNSQLVNKDETDERDTSNFLDTPDKSNSAETTHLNHEDGEFFQLDINSLCNTSSEATSDDKAVLLAHVRPPMSMLDSKPDASTLKPKKKVRRARRQKGLSNESEDLQIDEMNEEFFSTIGKYWCQRDSLFSRFDEGINMDEEGWFSVTPEPIARHQALRCDSGIIVDCFTGVGGNAIQFAHQIDYAMHNAAIYGVSDQIDFIKGDFFQLAPNLKAETVFLSPPWGGPDYAKVTKYDVKTMLKPHDRVYFLFSAAKKIASKIIMFLPRNVEINQLAELSLSTSPPWSLEVEKNFLNGKLKAITAYFSNMEDTKIN
ncbi:Trimethylguanosine synthase [Quillaja saponaria]|uniref:Trimethylguanosine synthase n=1 Tax=Quillaja saponaria TaxID=32244 RepID=A0AAD7LH96_QUISA|nr:Trimethylguanosine synthase [Quillaja saponaria]